MNIKVDEAPFRVLVFSISDHRSETDLHHGEQRRRSVSDESFRQLEKKIGARRTSPGSNSFVQTELLLMFNMLSYH
jgi:hypothetical protein